MITVYSIPHTGTRFVQAFYRNCGVITSRRHVGHWLGIDDGQRVIPVRDPYECYLSHSFRHPGRLTDAEFVGLWGRLLWRGGDFYFPLDAEDREGLMRAAAEFADVEYVPFEWKPINCSLRPKEECPEHMKKALGFAREWYEYHTDKWSE